jgi:hypothetical protein
MLLADIKPGMTIEYRGRVHGHGNLRGKHKARTGTVRQVTPNLIAVEGERYPDTILVNDLLSGQVQITNLKGEGEMARPKREAPPKAKLLALFEEHEGKIAPIAEELKASWGHTKRWLVDAGIITSLGQPIEQEKEEEKKQTPTPESEELGGENRNEGEEEPASEIIPESAMGCPFDEPAYNPEPYRKCEDCGKGLTHEEVREVYPTGHLDEESKILCSWCYSNYLNRQIPPEPVKMPIGCELPREDDMKVYTPERSSYTIAQYNEQIKQGGFAVADEEPIPYTVVEEKYFNLDSFKLRVLEIYQEVAAYNQAPAHVSLAFIDAIINVYPEVD